MRQQAKPHRRILVLLLAATTLPGLLAGLGGLDARVTTVAHAVSIALLQTRIEGTPQWTPEDRGSDNLEVVAHLPLGGRLTVADIDIEQELDRP